MNELIELKKDAKKLRKKSRKLGKLAYEKEKELQSKCIHAELVKTEEYINGSYYDRAECHNIYNCKLCGIEHHRDTTIGSFG